MKHTALLLALVCTFPPMLRATVQPASPFGDHMVLQRQVLVPVWGTAQAGERVTVRFGAQRKSVRAGSDGKWRVALDRLPASATPATFIITGSATQHRIEFTDVLVGEVWLASGQSNMVFTISRSRYDWAGVLNEEQEIAAADYPQIRMFTGDPVRAAQPQARVPGQWLVTSPASVAGFSAVGYFFAQELQQRIKVPIGIIVLAYGASTAEAWIGRGTMAADPKLTPLLDRFDEQVRNYTPASEDQIQRWQEASDKARVAGERPPNRPHPDPVQDQHNATVLFNGMINPVVPYAIRGVIWYQGESIVGGASGRALYPHVQGTLVRDWRRLWNNEKLYFYICQLAGQDASSNSPDVREAQATILDLPHTGMVVTIDIGEAHDVHPHNKKDVGDRLARIALANVYGADVEFSGPRYESMTVEGFAVRLKFSHTRGGLIAKGGGPLRGFEIAGAEGKYVPAEARIDGDTVVVSSSEVRAPAAARYAWQNFPDGCNLFNGAMLPAAPLRTDRLRN